MNKRELIGEVARRTGYAEEVCTRVLDTFEEVLGDAVANKVKDASDTFRSNAAEALDLIRGLFRKRPKHETEPQTSHRLFRSGNHRR